MYREIEKDIMIWSKFSNVKDCCFLLEIMRGEDRFFLEFQVGIGYLVLREIFFLKLVFGLWCWVMMVQGLVMYSEYQWSC